MVRLTPLEYATMPWKNGGGTTTELLIRPEGARLGSEPFLYRVSIADVASDGPFSPFSGYDHHIMLLAGEGMTLDAGPHGRFELRAFEPLAFSGDWFVRGELHGGPVKDFNVMVDRARGQAALASCVVATPETLSCPPGATCVLYVAAGELDVAREGETLVFEAPLEVRPHQAPARIVLVRISEPRLAR